MAQSSWTYPDEKGRHHSVGIYHGDRSGHFILYCNARIVTIDFKVFESKTYSFLIEDELCEIFLKKKEDGTFEYDFRVNEDIETPNNVQRKSRRKTDKKKTVLFFASFFLFITVLTFGMRTYFGHVRKIENFGEASYYIGTPYYAGHLKKYGQPAVATLSAGVLGQGKNTVQYELKSPNRHFESTFQLSAGADGLFLPNGFPLKSGDAFYATYDAKAFSKHHVLQFQKPTGETLLRYFELVLASEQTIFQAENPEKIACRIKTVLDKRGLEGLALLLHRNTPKSENETYNQEKAAQMLNSVFLQQNIDKACE